jgi:hypothetical protein
VDPQCDEDALPDLQGHSITYRIALGSRRGQKAFMLRTLAPCGEDRGGERVAQANGFSLHAGVAAEAEERGKLERLCRYISRPAVATERLSRTAQGHIRYALKTPYRDGTTHVRASAMRWAQRLKRVLAPIAARATLRACTRVGLLPALLMLSARRRG